MGKQGDLFEHSMEDLLRCEVAVLDRENKALRDDNNAKAVRIHQMECDAEAYRFRINILEARNAKLSLKLKNASPPHPWKKSQEKGTGNGTDRHSESNDPHCAVR